MMRAHLGAYAVLFLGHIALIWALPYIPTQDGPGHLYTLSLMRNPVPEYATRLVWVPNLGFTLPALLLHAILPLWAVERVFLTLYFALHAAALPALLRSFERPIFPLSHLGLCLAVNLPLLSGFYAFCLGVPLLLLTIAMARRWQKWRGTIVIVTGGLVLLHCHLVAWALFALALPLYAGEAWRRRLLESVPVAALAAFMAAGAPGSEASSWSWQPLASAARDLITLSIVTGSPWQLLPCAATILLLAPFVRLSHRGIACTVLGLALLRLAMPGTLLGGGYLGLRLPWIMVLLALPLVAPPQRRRLLYDSAMLTTCAAMLLLNAGVLTAQARIVETFVTGRGHVPRGATVATARFDGPRAMFPRWDPLLHADAHYGIAGAVVADHWQARSPHHFPVRAMMNSSTLPPPEAVYRRPLEVPWDQRPHPRYLLCWYLQGQDRSRVAAFFEPAWEQPGHPLSIWRRRTR